MALTRAAIEGRLVRAHRGLLELASLSTATDGANPTIGDVLEDALLRLGYSVSTPADVADADIAVVPARRHPHLYALASVLVMEAVYGTISAMPNEQANAQRVEWGNAAADLRRRIQDAWKTLAERFTPDRSGVAVSSPMQSKPYPPDALTDPWYEA
jgi:hypothetical protein